LKKAISANTPVSPELPNPSNRLQIPQAILDRRLHLHNGKTITHVLVKWSHLPIDLASWENEEALREEFPRAPAWGQAVSCGGGDVTDLGTKEDSQDEVSGGEGADGPEPDQVQDRALPSKRSRKPNARVYGPDWE
jgi:hypothetical protein